MPRNWVHQPDTFTRVLAHREHGVESRGPNTLVTQRRTVVCIRRNHIFVMYAPTPIRTTFSPLCSHPQSRQTPPPQAHILKTALSPVPQQVPTSPNVPPLAPGPQCAEGLLPALNIKLKCKKAFGLAPVARPQVGLKRTGGHKLWPASIRVAPSPHMLPCPIPPDPQARIPEIAPLPEPPHPAMSSTLGAPKLFSPAPSPDVEPKCENTPRLAPVAPLHVAPTARLGQIIIIISSAGSMPALGADPDPPISNPIKSLHCPPPARPPGVGFSRHQRIFARRDALESA
ncbi:hypothetical protein BD779DRAFT_1478423 [Infundibulicybe gibba]|nr:hypothetical protein BD779DRAFT_1478423 [Infundibulicybe gibba]